MKITSIVAYTLPFLVLGCKREAQPVQSQPPAPAQSTTLSNGGYAWTAGAVRMDGTNVPMSNITVRVIQSANTSPDTNAVSK
jgi:hypothetical protein